MVGHNTRIGLLAVALGSFGSALWGQSVTLTPSYPPVDLGKSVQFSAQVTGLSDTAVVWYVNDVKGGNSTLGTITQTGLYTAPTVLPKADVEVVAVSAANSAILAAQYVDILVPGPAITAVSPDPFPVGTNTVTITGSGFQPGAFMWVRWGSNYARESPTSVTPTTITVEGQYLGGASSATFTVTNPGSDYSNAVTVPLGFPLTVAGGTGSGVYPPGTVVTITASAPPAGEVFSRWTGATVADATAARTTLTMPAAATRVKANYTAAAYALTVVNGSGSGSYEAGTVVTIKANPAPAGEWFSKWTGATVASATSATTTLTMPAAATTVTANYAAIPTYTLTVVNGTGSGSYAAGTVVTITANAAPAGQAFADWTGATVASATSATTTLTMPAATTTVTATYSAQPPATASCANMSLGNNASLNGFVPFPSTYAWNTDISSAPLDPNSDAITSASGFAGLHLHHDFSSVAGGNYGIPYVVVDSSTTPLVPINVLDYADESDIANAPYPLSAPIEGAPADCSGWPDTYVGDAHVLVLDRNACVLYETFNTHRCNGAWNASSETIWDMQKSEQRPWGWTSADAAGLAIFPGLVRYDEVASGAINHAIRFTMQVTKNDANGGYFVSPASHAAGVYWGVSNVMGMRVRLKSSFDISGYSAANQVILTAMKKYGMILADNGGYFYFQGVPDTRWNDSDLLNLDAIQSSNFEVVQMTPEWPGYDSATAPTGPPPTIESFTASATTVAAGTPVALSWVTLNDSYDFIDKLGGVNGNTVTVTPAATTTYTLNATNQFGRSTMQVTVYVQ